MGNTIRALRLARAWFSGRGDVHERALRIEREDRPVSARLMLPSSSRGPHPAWLVLHGVTRPGIEHPQLLRFARALASAGTVTLVPEVPEWKELRLAPSATLPTLRAAIRALRGIPEAGAGARGVIGFSFGGPQALIAAADETVASEIALVVSFGGYCDLERTLRFQFTGEHEWHGVVERAQNPDPYGRWIVGANYLASSPGFEGSVAVARALWELAAAAGSERRPASSGSYDALKERLRREIPSGERAVFDVFAPASGVEPDRIEAEAVIRALVSGGRRLDPLVDPNAHLHKLRHPVELLHGRRDTLIPYTESLRLGERLPSAARAHVTVTGLFAHARGDRSPLAQAVTDGRRLWRALRRVLEAV